MSLTPIPPRGYLAVGRKLCRSSAPAPPPLSIPALRADPNDRLQFSRFCSTSPIPTASDTDGRMTTQSPGISGKGGETRLWRWGGGSSKRSSWGGFTSLIPRIFSREGSTSDLLRDSSILPTEIEGFSDTTAVSVGQEHAAFIDSGRVYTYGSNRLGQLGREIPPDGEGTRKKGLKNYDPVPRPVDIASDSRAMKISCGAFHSAVILENGTVWTWGWGGSRFSGPSGLGGAAITSQIVPQRAQMWEVVNDRVTEYPGRVVDVACGNRHSLAVLEDGRVASCGTGEYGPLGNGSTRDQLVFQPLPFFSMWGRSDRVLKVAAGGQHSLCLTDRGEIFVWGQPSRGQLGLGESIEALSQGQTWPRELRQFVLERVQIADIAACEDSSLAVSTEGVIYFWGRALWVEPRALNLPPSFETSHIEGTPTKVSSGKSAYAALTLEGRLYVWGSKRSAQLGVENPSTVVRPTLISPASFKNEAVIDVAMGPSRVLAVSLRGEPPISSPRHKSD